MESCVQLTDLPNEILMLIVSFLDTRTVLHLTCVCRRLRAVVSDPTGPQWSAIGWKSSNHSKDADGLKLALKLSKASLKKFSLSCRSHHFPLSKFMHLLTRSTRLQSVSLDGVMYTEAYVSTLMQLPTLRYLHLDTAQPSLRLNDWRKIDNFFLLARRNRHLETLSLKIHPYSVSLHGSIDSWSQAGYYPCDLRLFVPLEPTITAIPKFHRTATPQHEAYLSAYYQPHSQDIISAHLYFQYRFSSSGITPLYCSDMQLIVASEKPGSDEVVSAKYWDISMEGSVAFSDICNKLSKLDVSGFKNPLSSGLQEVIAVSCPNLVSLNLQSCTTILSDLSGMKSIADNCLKLRVLNLLDLHLVESLEGLWVILASMSNLRVLYLSSDLLVPPDLDVPLPKLTAIAIKGDNDSDNNEINPRVNNLVYSMASLEIIKLIDLYADLFSDSLLPLCTYSNLTHLYLKTKGRMLVLPTDPACYESLQELFVFAFGFEVDGELTRALIQSRELRVVMLHGCCFERTDDIAKIVVSIPTLAAFHLFVTTFEGRFFRTGSSCSAFARVFVKSLTKSLKSNGRRVDFKLCNYWHDDAAAGNLQFLI